MTKGMLANYFGGPEVVKLLNDERKPSPVVLLFFLSSIGLQLLLWVYKKVKTYRIKKLHTYIESLRQNLGIFTVTVSFLFVQGKTIYAFEDILSVNGK